MKGVTGRFSLLVFLVSVAALPSFARAQVVIDEIMYNPAGSDTGREWIELYNSGASDVTMVAGSAGKTWKVNDGSNHNLVDPATGVGRGVLTIPAGGYLVIASDPTEFISGEYAGGSYPVIKSSISLNNTGTTVSLLDNTSGASVTVDIAAYTSALGGNDDGNSLQKRADGSWIAALPTPGAENATDAGSSSNNSGGSSNATSSNATSTSQTQTTSVPTPEPSYVAPPTPDLYADAGSDRTVIVGADVEFDAEAYDKNQDVVPDARFSWNFGDGSTAEGESVMHHFDYPGRYAVILNIAQDKFAASDEAVVTAEPAKLSFSILPDGGVAIGNDAGRDLDLSEWVVRQGSSPFAPQFILPDHSAILAGSSMHISKATLQFSATSTTMLEYPNGALAVGAGGTTVPSANDGGTQNAAPAVPAAGAAPSPVEAARAAPLDAPADPSDPSDTDPPDAGTAPIASSTPTTTSQTAAAASGSSPNYLWWLGALALAGAAACAVLASRHFGRREWDIVEDASD